MSPTIAVTQRIVQHDTYAERRDALAHDWTCWLEQVWQGAVVLPVPNNLTRVERWLGGVAPELVVLTGGNDWGTEPARDRTELELLAHCQAGGIPVFGVCRGLQVLHASLGGTVRRLPSRATPSHVSACHDVELSHAAFTTLAGADRISTNSFHEQAVLRGETSDELVVWGSVGDIVEGLAHRTDPVLAVQWHPERPGATPRFDRSVLEALVERGAFWSTS